MPKSDLILRTPLMNAAGTLGFAPEARAEVAWEELGAFVTNPIAWRAREAAEEPVVVEYPGGCLIHTGLPNPGFQAVLHQFSRRWAEAALPIIVHLMVSDPDETSHMVEALEIVDNVMAVELGFAPHTIDELILITTVKCRGELPLIVSLSSEQVIRLGERVIEKEAAVISMAPSRGTLPYRGKQVSGRLYGPSLFPTALETVRMAAKAGLPVIGAGGVYSDEAANAMIKAGAMGVQIDTQLWLPGGYKTRAPSS